MSVVTRINVEVVANESSVLDLGTASMPHRLAIQLALATGTGDNQFDIAWSDTRTLTATSEDLDLSGALTGALGSTFSAVEVGLILIRNRATAAASRLLVGAGSSNPVFAGYLGSGNDIRKVGAGGFDLWVAPLDGGGMTVTNSSADKLKIDAGAATITYDIIVLGRSA